MDHSKFNHLLGFKFKTMVHIQQSRSRRKIQETEDVMENMEFTKNYSPSDYTHLEPKI